MSEEIVERARQAYQAGRLTEAAALFGQAIAADGSSAESHFYLGNILIDQGRKEEAVAAYRRCVELQPGNPVTLYNLAAALHEAGRPEEAIAYYRSALAVQPNFADAAYNLGAVLREVRRPYEAIAAYRQVLAIQPEYLDAHNDLGQVWSELGDYDQAMAYFDRELALHPNHALARSNRFLSMHYHPRYTPEQILREHRQWDRQNARAIQPHTNIRDPERRLKIGYVSPDFRRHCESFFTIPLLSHHDHRQFEICAYASVAKPDELTQRIKGYCDVWQNTVGQSDVQVAHQIRADGIDILIDLTMHMAGGRPLLFAAKPAPVQLAWLAYPGTTGLSAMDYRLTDPYLDPPGEHDEWYSEKSIRLPETFWCYDPLTDQPEVNALPALQNGYLTFGSLNNFCKVTDQTLSLWSRVLKATPNSRLILLSQAGEHRQRVLSGLDVEPRRVEFVEYQPRERYLRTYLRIDLCLDTFPVNGHTTSLDALWMGVPVMSMEGRAANARAAISQSTNLGLAGELVGKTPEEFISLTLDLAGNLARLSELRRTLRGRMAGSVLMDGARFARNIEAIFRDVWRVYCR
ncbi:MAG: tetratricopeptide repeat protein [Tepidisphaeraceae bacterium]|jgi:predicted O-linked N-acetylglucosamine transferase (SPINDLY family)